MISNYKDGDKFDQFIQKEVDQVTFAFDETAWADLSGMLDQHEENIKSRNRQTLKDWLKWLAGVAGLGVVLFAVIYVLQTAGHVAPTTEVTIIEETSNSNATSSSELEGNEITLSENNHVDDLLNQNNVTSIRRSKVNVISALKLMPTQVELDFNDPIDWNEIEILRGDVLLEHLEQLKEENRKKYLLW